MKILLFGGTFDPPHIGHKALLQGAIKAVQPDLVLVEPAGIPPHKAAAHTAAAVRLAMCRTFLSCGKNIKIDQTELRRAGKSYSIDTVNTLRRRYPGSTLYFCMGSDMLLYFKMWKSWQQLLQKVVLVVQCRRTEDIAACSAFAQQLTAAGGRVLFTTTDIVEVSSTEIRAAVHSGKGLSRLVPPDVARIILRKNLYTTEANT